VILSDADLREYIRSGKLVVEPFTEEMVRENGLDLSLGEELCVAAPSTKVLEDMEPLDVNDAGSEEVLAEYYRCYRAVDGEIVLRPEERALLHTREYIRMPNDLMGFVELRSTFARLGFLMPPTIIDAGFEGQLTVEVAAPPFPVEMRVGTRFLHVVFARLSRPVEKPYSGRYQGQRGVTLPKLPVNHYRAFAKWYAEQVAR